MIRRWFDAHLDLAFLAETGRDMHAPLSECRGRIAPPAVTLPSLAEGRVTHALATVYTAPYPGDDAPPESETGPWNYRPDDTLSAYKAGMRQLKLYRAWREAGVVRFLRDAADERSESGGSVGPLTIGILMENADPIESPEQLDEWVEGGVVAVGLAWATPSRYAAGNSIEPADDFGLTDLGRAFVARMDELGVVHDLSHLSPRAVAGVLEATDKPVIASHSNCRALMTHQGERAAQRHLDDATIREIARRGGVVGINLYSPFLDAAIGHGSPERASIAAAVAHVEHACELIGDRRHVALGSDMDGGFPANRLPEAVDTPADLRKLAEALSARGWSDADVNAFAFDNWARFWRVPAGD
ncbi:MAG: membrane dipeptidase [Phycisphaerales bacterium]